ncbi:MAG: patatin-like phospholipase family protein [Myxococcaceae bacterium]|nr:patatin-like phospholipase family protein [Myxococcaceae bacterium]
MATAALAKSTTPPRAAFEWELSDKSRFVQCEGGPTFTVACSETAAPARHLNDSDAGRLAIPSGVVSIAAAVETWLGPVEPDVVATLEHHAEVMALQPGDVLFREGDVARACFLVLEGRVGAYGAGACLGCAEALSSSTFATTVTALRESRVARLPVEALEAAFPRSALALARGAVVKEPAARWAFVRLDESPRLVEAAARLVAALGPAQHVSGPTLDRAWLEAQPGPVVLDVDVTRREWLRHVDHVVLLAEAGASPALRPVEERLGGCARTLMLIHRDRSRRPSGTARWLARRPGVRHLHIADDFDRAARVLTGRSIAVALSGGASRGFAHIGALRALREAGIPIDAFGGTSTGAAMGAQAAMGLGFDEMVELNQRIFSLKPFREVTLPVFSLIGGTRVDRGLQEAYGDLELEDLWIPHLAVSASLSTAKLFVHERGPVWKAVRASCSLPAVAVPVLEDGQLLIDGGLINNLPVDLLRERGAGRVIAFNASGTGGALGGPASPAFPSPWRAMWSRLTAGAEGGAGLPGIIEILMRSVQLASDGHARAMGELADFHLRFPVEQYGLLEVERVREIATAGYTHAKPHVARWKVAM